MESLISEANQEIYEMSGKAQETLCNLEKKNTLICLNSLWVGVALCIIYA